MSLRAKVSPRAKVSLSAEVTCAFLKPTLIFIYNTISLRWEVSKKLFFLNTSFYTSLSFVLEKFFIYTSSIIVTIY